MWSDSAGAGLKKEIKSRDLQQKTESRKNPRKSLFKDHMQNHSNVFYVPMWLKEEIEPQPVPTYSV
jgi:hypothetical protein